MAPRIWLGTLNFDYPYTSGSLSGSQAMHTASQIVETFARMTEHVSSQDQKIYIDTAYYYGMSRTEKLLGEIFKAMDPNWQSKLRVCGKANPWHANQFETGKMGALSADGVLHQASTSLKNLGLDAFDTFLLHAYDYETPLAETLDACETLYRHERFHHFGISNMSLAQLQSVLEGCESRTLKLSTYQGMYNVMCRKVEPIIYKMHEIGGSFVAYNPLAGGMLTGKYNALPNTHPDTLNTLSDCRFKNNGIYQSIFWKDPMLDYCKKLKSPLSDALTWLTRHSLLDGLQGDGIVIGASTCEQLRTVLDSDSILLSLDRAYVAQLQDWYDAIADATPNYWY